MKKKKKSNLKEQKINLILIVVVLIFMVVNIAIIIKYISSETSTTDVSSASSDIAEESSEEDTIETMSEQERIQEYARQFIVYLDDEEYEKAYNLLNSEFKNNYFPTLEAFETYVNENIGTGELTINFTNIERLGNEKTGNLYVLWTNIYDVVGHTKQSTEDEEDYINIVILENDYNDYELSFTLK